MKTTNHTSGPWTHTPSREHSNPDTTRRDIVAESQFGPAFIAGDVSQSDARLIASAPEMLQALESCLDYLLMDSMIEEDAAPEIESIRKAIAKAKGEA
jgi:hypothetical protein